MAVTTHWEITRTLLSLSNLVLGDVTLLVPDGSGVTTLVPRGSVNLGKVGRRQTINRSAFIAGGSLISDVADLVPGAKIAVRIEGVDYPTVITREAAVIAAFTQRTYSLLWSSSDAGQRGWTCLPADVEMTWDEEWEYGFASTTVYTFSRQPTPLFGSY